MPREIEYSLTEEDVVAFYLHHRANRRTRNVVRWILVGLLVLLTGFVLWITHFRAAQGGNWGDFFVYLLPPLVLLLLMTVFWRPLQSWQVKSQVRQTLHDQKLLGIRRLTITQEGISQALDFAAGLVVWSGIEKIAVTADHAFFYMTADNAYVLPKRAFGAESEFEEFVDTAQRYLEAAKADSKL